ncbi:DUF29 family protein [Roseomonas sp. CCTCC AB2023176]|uniref:DUF29 family protein n=1 Tax=Roseomonas sp. CCTCC AB2023176 TaxID=3342640 RepID=UPI0035DA9A48
MPDDRYHRDIMAWSASQAERLRRLRDGEQVNDLDWDNVIEEVESVGKSELQAVLSLYARHRTRPEGLWVAGSHGGTEVPQRGDDPPGARSSAG